MNYPGNETLAEEIRERILNTFRQTLDLTDKGDLREAQLGCDFVLRLDPLFEPARELNERLQDPSGSVDVVDLRAKVSAGAEATDAQAATAPESQTTNDLDPALPPQPTADSDEPAVELDLDTAPDALDAALDLSSFEPEPASAASEPTPPEPAPSADAPAEDGEPVAALDDESEQRVEDLLAEGQAAFEKAEYQSAIDAWSRIFLIDIDHPEANRRIDLARKLKAEVERKLEETYHDAVGKVESGRLDEARQGFSAVLEMMPGHVAAREYLARLDAPDFQAPEAAPAQTGVPLPEDIDDFVAVPGEPTDEISDIMDTELLKPSDPVSAEATPAIGGVGRASKPARSSNQTFKIVGAAALVLLSVVGWLLFKNWSTFFPNTTDVAPTVQLDPITRAKRTYAEAGAAIAIAQLRRLSPGHPQYAEAQALLAQWEAALDASDPNKEEPEPEALAARDRLVEEAQLARNEGLFHRAAPPPHRGAGHAPLGEAATLMLEEAESQIAPIQSEIAMFREGEWELALRSLWRMWEGGSDTPDVRRLMIDSYFNLGVRDLQRNDPEAAITNFREAGELAGEDAQLVRLISFAQTYQNRPSDLLYRIFVKYLPFR